MRVDEFVRATLSGSVAHLVACDRQYESDNSDPEVVHQMRVCVRRLRSALRTLAPALDRRWAQGLRDQLRGVSDELSAARDADVMLQRARSRIAQIDPVDRLRSSELLAVLTARRGDTYARVARMRREPSYAALLKDLAAAAEHPAIGAQAQGRARDLAAPLLGATYKRLRKRVRHCGRHPADSQLHAVRIAAKHLRYALEAFECVCGKTARRWAGCVERLQNVLGEEHDAVVLSRFLHELPADAATSFVAGELATLESRTVERARSRWRRAWRGVKGRGGKIANKRSTG
ncbi:MAG TPA: CHAD domain-containing protein [Candidatus Tyrphobacter sp.]